MITLPGVETWAGPPRRPQESRGSVKRQMQEEGQSLPLAWGSLREGRAQQADQLSFGHCEQFQRLQAIAVVPQCLALGLGGGRQRHIAPWEQGRCRAALWTGLAWPSAVSKNWLAQEGQSLPSQRGPKMSKHHNIQKKSVIHTIQGKCIVSSHWNFKIECRT